jgi:hypothetical protein
MDRKPGSKKLILEFFLKNIGKVLQSRQIQAASGGASEWARRVRELRNEDDYQILTHKDRVDLKPKSIPVRKCEASSFICPQYLKRNACLGIREKWIYLPNVWICRG